MPLAARYATETTAGARWGYQSLLESERALLQQQDSLAESRSLVGINLVALYKDLGGGWQARLGESQPAAAPSP